MTTSQALILSNLEIIVPKGLTNNHSGTIIVPMETKVIYQATTKLKQYHLRLPAELHQWLKAEAEKNSRSMAVEIVEALEAWRKSKSKENDQDEHS